MQIQHRGARSRGVRDGDNHLVIPRRARQRRSAEHASDGVVSQPGRVPANAHGRAVASGDRKREKPANEPDGIRRSNLGRRCQLGRRSHHRVAGRIKPLLRNDLRRLTRTEPGEDALRVLRGFIVVELDVVADPADHRDADVTLIAVRGPVFDRFIDDINAHVARTQIGILAGADIYRECVRGRRRDGTAGRCRDVDIARARARDPRRKRHRKGIRRCRGDGITGAFHRAERVARPGQFHRSAHGEAVRRQVQGGVSDHRGSRPGGISIGAARSIQL